MFKFKERVVHTLFWLFVCLALIGEMLSVAYIGYTVYSFVWSGG